MRTTLLLCLLSVSFGVGSLSLVIVHSILGKQIRTSISTDLQRSMAAFRNLQALQQQTLQHEASLLAALPVLKSLMTTADTRTIRDGAVGFSALSGGDLFGLAGRDGQAIAMFPGGGPTQGEPKEHIPASVFLQRQPGYLVYQGSLYVVATHPLYFGPESGGTQLGYVLLGHAVNDRVAQQVGQDAAAAVAFSAAGIIHAANMPEAAQAALTPQIPSLLAGTGAGQDISLGGEHFVGAAAQLQGGPDPVDLVVLKSWDQASSYLTRLNRLLLVWGAFLLAVSALLAVLLSATITRPLDRLVAGTRALGAGNFDYHLRRAGVREIRELGEAFDLMRRRLLGLREELLAAERLATIGQMASSISHDLRHYLSAVYANAEFLGYNAAGPHERMELLAEIRKGVRGMTELIESLLLFSRTGKSLQLGWEPVASLVDRSLAVVRAHPDARNVEFVTDAMPQADVWVDTLKIERALSNLILNASQAARQGAGPPRVHLSCREEAAWFFLRVADNGPGVPDAIRNSLFQPFVSQGKPSGLGLGLALAQKIAQEHNGSVMLDESQPGFTVFTMALAREGPRQPAEAWPSEPTPAAVD
ncbi:MAG TPA: HAMP domain-containing sensor histidine kinase [Acidobacteriaceae bacterium]|jgi:signal transduction histidine kinase|nr:HAMP domain-containing sensor histidine kinase [Acidobacteriaceae bacterium]